MLSFSCERKDPGSLRRILLPVRYTTPFSPFLILSSNAWPLDPEMKIPLIPQTHLIFLSPVDQDSEEDLPELGPRLLVLRRHVGHEVHDEAPDDVVVHDLGVGGREHLAEVAEVGHGVADDALRAVVGDVAEDLVEVEPPVDLGHLGLQVVDRELGVDGARVEPVLLRYRDLCVQRDF